MFAEKTDVVHDPVFCDKQILRTRVKYDRKIFYLCCGISSVISRLVMLDPQSGDNFSCCGYPFWIPTCMDKVDHFQARVAHYHKS